jgi:ribonuclease P protein component
MIAAAHRFHGHASLRYVYQNGRTVRCGHIGLKYAPNSRRSRYRAAVVISKKVHKSAVIRNRIRRRVYEQLRLQLAESTAPYDLVFTVFQTGLETLPSSQLAALIADLLQKSGVVSQQKSPVTVAKTRMHAIVKPNDE